MPRILAIDVGTSSCRASLYTLDGQMVRGSLHKHRYLVHTTRDGGAELNAEALFHDLCEAIDGAAGRPDILAVGAAVFWHSLVGLDESGAAVTPVFLWLDARSKTDAADLRETLDEPTIHQRTGCRLHWSYWPAKLRWIHRTQPDQAQQVRTWTTFGEYAYGRFFGRPLPMSVSQASATGLLADGGWDSELTAACSVNLSRLPAITNELVIQGLAPQFARRWPNLAEIPWVLPVGDGAVSNVGAGCTVPTRLAVMVGTSAAIRILGSFTPPRLPGSLWRYRLDADRVVVGAALNDGGSLLDWLRRTLVLPQRDTLERALAGHPAGEGLAVIPFWGGGRSPDWPLEATGSITGLRIHTNPITIYHAALVAVADQIAVAARAVDEALSTPFTEVIATGGALLGSPTFQQLLANALGRDIRISSEREGSSRGVALYAASLLGHGGIDQQIPVVDHVVSPQTSG